MDRILPEPEKYASSSFDGKILEYYKGYFESIYILLHPFFKPNKLDIELFDPHTWPSKKEIINDCTEISWNEMLNMSTINSISDLDIALRTLNYSLKEKFRNNKNADIIIKINEEHNIICPDDYLPEILENKIYNAIKKLGHKWLWVGDEFCTERKLHFIDDLIEENIQIDRNLFTSDHSILVSTPFDCHYTLLCSSKKSINDILEIDNLEGFFCSEKTETDWCFSDNPI